MCVIHVVPENTKPKDTDPYVVPDHKFNSFIHGGIEKARDIIKGTVKQEEISEEKK